MATFSVARQFLEDRIESDNMSFCNATNNLIVASESNINGSYISSIIGGKNHTIDGDNFTKNNSHILGGVGNINCCSSNSIIIGSSQSVITSSTFSSIINSNLSCICAGSAYSDIIGGFQNSIVNQTMSCGTGVSMFGFSLILSSKCSIIDNPEGVCTKFGDSTIIGSQNSSICCALESSILSSKNSSIRSGSSISIINSSNSYVDGNSSTLSVIQNSENSKINNSIRSLILNSQSSFATQSTGAFIASSTLACSTSSAYASIISSGAAFINNSYTGTSGASSVILGSFNSGIVYGRNNLVIGSLDSTICRSDKGFIANSCSSRIFCNSCKISLIINSNTSCIDNSISANNGWSSAIVSSQGSCITSSGVIIGSNNSCIITDSCGSIILGGSGLCIGSGQHNTALVQCLRINTVNNDNTLDRVLMHDPSDGYIKYKDLSTIGGGGGSTAIRQNEIAFGTGTGITSSGRFTHIPNQELYSRASYTEFNGSFNATYSYTEFIGSGTNTLVNDYGYTGIISRTYSVTIDGNNVYEILYNGVYGSSSKVWNEFNGTNGSTPWNKLIEYGDYFYGITYDGGSQGVGVIFKIRKDSSDLEKLLDFSDPYVAPNGLNPVGIVIYDDYIYGVTTNSDNGYGTIFRCNLDGSDFQYLTEFNSNGYDPNTEPIVVNGKLYGVCQEDSIYGYGCIYEFDIESNTLNFIYYFDGTNGNQPWGPLTLYNGRLYGTTRTDGINGSGIIFRIDINATNFTVLYALDDSLGDGNGHRSKLLIDQGVIYGVVENGGGVLDGTIFKMNIDGTGFTKLYDLNGPRCELLLINGFLYGTEQFGGSNGNGSIFKISTTGTGFEYIYDFPVSTTPGTQPTGIIYSNNKFWVTPLGGGSFGNGTILSINYNFLSGAVESITDLNTSATANILGFTDLGNGTYSIVVDNPTSTISPGDVIDNGIGITASVLQINGPYDTFTWDDGDASLGNNILNLVQNTLSYGEKIHFTSDTGNTIGDSWTWQVLIASYSTMMLLDGGQKKVSIPMMADGLNHTLGIDPQGTLVFKTDTSGLLPLPTPNVQISSFYQGLTQASIAVSNQGISGIEGYATMSRFPIVVTTGFLEDHFSNPENRIFVEMLTYKRKHRKKNLDGVKSNKSGFVSTPKNIASVGEDTLLPWGTNFWSRSGEQRSTTGILPFDRPNYYEVMGHTISTLPVYEYLNGRFIYDDILYQDTTNTENYIQSVIPILGRRKLGKRPTSRFAYSPKYTPLYVCFRYIQWIPSTNNGRGQIIEGPMSKIIKVMSEQFAFNVNYSLSAIYGRPVTDISPNFDPWRLNCYFESNVP
jgi:uncharacterized repeat protein (TIGR03803 family)